jgi:hypothetical protein
MGSATRRNALAALLLLLVAFLLVLVVLRPIGSRSSADRSSPPVSAAGPGAVPRTAPVLVPPAEAGPEEVSVRLRDVTAFHRRFATVPLVDVLSILPEHDLPSLPTTDALLEYASSGRSTQDESVHRVLDSAVLDGIVGDPEAALASPGRAFLELEVARLRVEHGYYHETLVWVREFIEPDEAIEDHFGDVWLNTPGRPVQDPSELLGLAAAVEARFAGEPAADYARLYQALGGFPKGMRSGRDEHDLAPLFDALRGITDPAIAEQAATVVSTFDPWNTIPAGALELLEALRTSTLESEVALTTFGLERSVRAADWEGAARWGARHRDGVRRLCPAEDVDTQCRSLREQARDADARLTALGLHEPDSWQASLASAVWRCQLSDGPHSGVSTGEGAFVEGRWRWSGWDRTTPVSACSSAAAVDAPHPAEGTLVRLTLEGPEVSSASPTVRR